MGRPAPSPDPRIPIKLRFESPRGPIVFRLEAVADSGAQITVIPADMVYNLDVPIKRMNHSSRNLNAANNVPIEVLGFTEVEIEATSPCGQHFATSTVVYLVENVSEVFLSLEVMRALQIVDRSFPTAGSGLRHRRKGAPMAPCGCNFTKYGDASRGNAFTLDVRHQWPYSRTSYRPPQMEAKPTVQASSITPYPRSWAREQVPRGKVSTHTQGAKRPGFTGDYRGQMGDQLSARWPVSQHFARALPKDEPRDWYTTPQRGGGEERARQRPSRSRRKYASPKKPITRCWGVRCTVGDPPPSEGRGRSNAARRRLASEGAEGGVETRRSGETAANRMRHAVPTMSPPPTKFPFAREAGNTSPQGRAAGAASGRRGSGRANSREAGRSASRGSGGEAVRIAAGSTRGSPDEHVYARDPGRVAADPKAGGSRHSGHESPQEEY